VEIILLGRTNGECSARDDVNFQARAFYLMYFAAVRWWIYKSDPKVKAGLAELKALFALQVRGLRP
jgi:hypothetical protein